MSTGFRDENRLQVGARIHRKRAHKIFDIALSGQIMSGTHTIDADVVNVSIGGARVTVHEDIQLATGVSVVFVLEGFKPRFACVRWSSGQTYGLQFLGSAENDSRFKEFVDRLENAENLGS